MAAVDTLQVKRRWVLGTRVFNLPLSSWSLQEGGDPEGRSCGGMPTMRDVQELSWLADTDNADPDCSAFPRLFCRGKGIRARGGTTIQTPSGLWDLNSPTRDRTLTPCIGRQSLNHWTTREIPPLILITCFCFPLSVFPQVRCSCFCCIGMIFYLVFEPLLI